MSELKVGRELDILIATRVMGQTRAGDCGFNAPDCPGKFEPQVGRWPCLPPYSGNIEAAWQIVEKHRLCVVPCEGSQWTAFEQGKIFEQRDRFASDTVAMAICKCALDIAEREGVANA